LPIHYPKFRHPSKRLAYKEVIRPSGVKQIANPANMKYYSNMALWRCFDTLFTEMEPWYSSSFAADVEGLKASDLLAKLRN